MTEQKNQETAAMAAAQAMIQRKALFKCRNELYNHLPKAVEVVEFIRGLSDVLAETNGIDKEYLWKWAKRELIGDES